MAEAWLLDQRNVRTMLPGNAAQFVFGGKNNLQEMLHNLCKSGGQDNLQEMLHNLRYSGNKTIYRKFKGITKTLMVVS